MLIQVEDKSEVPWSGFVNFLLKSCMIASLGLKAGLHFLLQSPPFYLKRVRCRVKPMVTPQMQRRTLLGTAREIVDTLPCDGRG